MSVPVIEAAGLTKVYRTFKKEPGLLGAVRGLVRRRYEETRAADSVSFTIEEGEFVGFLGPNGAGKTTTLKMLSGLLFPTAGRARVLGFVPWERRDGMKRQFALLMGQKNALWWDLPARESLELNRAIYGIEHTQFQRVVGELSRLLGVEDKMSVMVRELSLGERMKMELIAALLHSPRVLFLDEPTIGLDVVSQKKVREFLREYNAQHRVTIVLTSHYMADIEELCPRVILINGGRLRYDGPLAGIVDRFSGEKILRVEFSHSSTPGAPRNLPARLGAEVRVLVQTPDTATLQIPRAEVADVCRRLLEAGAEPVRDFSVEDMPIEDVISRLFVNEGEGEPSLTTAGAAEH